MARGLSGCGTWAEGGGQASGCGTWWRPGRVVVACGQADPVQMRRMMLGDSTGTMSTEHMDAAMRSVQQEKEQSAMIEAMKACPNCIPPKVSSSVF